METFEMAIRRPKPPPEWSEVRNDDGMVIGWYGVRDGTITVRHAGGGTKTTRAGPLEAVAGLARLILSEKF